MKARGSRQAFIVRDLVRALRLGSVWARAATAAPGSRTEPQGRLGHPASIPRAIMSRSPEALAFGSRRHFIPASLSLPLCGCLLNRSRDCSRSRVPRFPRRRYADAPAAASFCCLRFAPALFGASPRDRFVGCAEARVAGRHPFGASILSKKTAARMRSPFPRHRR